MRRWKKILSMLVIVCMLCPCVSMIVHAASAEVRFSDPSTTVGAEVEVAIRVTSSADIVSLNLTLAYDTDKLRFISGDSATGGSGTITMNCTGESIEDGFTLKFQALAEGTGKVTISQSSGTDTSGSGLDITEGNSAVTIGPGDPSLIQPEEGDVSGGGAAVANGPQVEIDGVQYIVTNDFSDALIPEGFSRGEMILEGATCQVATQPVSNVSAFYLTPAAGGEPEFFLYDGDKGSFLPFESVSISSDRYIILLRDDGSVNLPKRYQETVLTLNGKEFPAWQDVDMAEYYVLYALNADGQKGMYQYDTVDKTYQRYVEHTAEAKEKKTPKGWWNKVLQFVSDFLDIVLIVGMMLMLVLIAFLVVVSVKLRNRNLELDDLYDEYDIDPDRDDEPMPKAKKPAPGKEIKKAVRRNADEPAVRVPVKTMSLKEEDLFDDYDSLDDDDDAFDGFDSDDYDDDDGYGDDDYGYDDDDYDDDDGYGGGSNDMIDDLDDLLNLQSQKKRGQKKGDTFQVDFIDLD